MLAIKICTQIPTVYTNKIKPNLLFVFFKESNADLLGNDLGPDVVLVGQAVPHLLQDQLHLLLLLH